MRYILNIFASLFFVFFFNIAYSYSAETEINCPMKIAKIYFDDPNIVSAYSSKYYCSDILYLRQSGKGNIPLSEYNKLYPLIMSNNINYLRQLGFTPDKVENFISEINYSKLSNKNDTDSFIKFMISEVRENYDYLVVFDKKFEVDKDVVLLNFKGDILNKEKNYKSCSVIKEKSKEEYLNEELTYRKVVSMLPVALSPVVLDGNKFLNLFGEEIAVLKSDLVLGKKYKNVLFSNAIFKGSLNYSIKWKSLCKINKLEEILERNSNCFFCPFIIMLFEEISYLFDYMYSNFKNIIFVFLVVFSVLFIVFEFLKGFKGIPFSADFSFFPKSIANKMYMLLVTLTLILVPVPKLFSWTVEPVINLTMAVSSVVLDVGSVKTPGFECDANSIVDAINEKQENKTALPPVVKDFQIDAKLNKNVELIISKETMGNIVCFLNNTLKTNGKYMMMAEVLVRNLFDFNDKSKHKLLGFVFGVILFGLFFAMNLIISFYILDGLLQFLKLAITWPFAVVGYLFNIVGIAFSFSSVIGMARSFGLTMVNLSVFSLFNSALINSFYFINVKEGILDILNKAIETNDKTIITSAIPFDILSVSKFLFIIYCIYYAYSNLSEFASYYGGQTGGISIGNNLKQLIHTSISTITGVPIRKDQGFVETELKSKNAEKISDTKDKSVSVASEEGVNDENF